MDEYGRPEPPQQGSEAATVLGYLEFMRATLEWKCRDVDDEGLRASLDPTAMTLGGLLKHVAWVEDYWCTQTLAGQPMPEPWASVDWSTAGEDWEWTSAADDTGVELREQWVRSVERSRVVVDGLLAGDEEAAMSRTHGAWGGQAQVSLRWVLVHLVEEYARHNGHADLLREAVDGHTGE